MNRDPLKTITKQVKNYLKFRLGRGIGVHQLSAQINELSTKLHQTQQQLFEAQRRHEALVSVGYSQLSIHNIPNQGVEVRVGSLENILDLLGPLVMEGRKVDLVDFGDLAVFMYTDDIAYRQLSPTLKCFAVEEFRRRRRDVFDNVISPQTLFESACASKTVLDIVLAHFWLNDLDFTYLDIGCQYGSSAMKVARSIKACGQFNRIHCFEPGLAGALVLDNLYLNRLEERIEFYPVAVSDHTGVALLFTEIGHTENNRVVNRFPDNETLSRVVRTTSIDDHRRTAAVSGPIVVKVDTQGGEYEVLAGMEKARADRWVAGIWEFTPWALATRTSPDEFLKNLGRDAFVVDLSSASISTTTIESAGSLFREVKHSLFSSFSDQVMSRPEKWTDLLVLPKSLPAVDQLMSKLVG